MSNSRGRRVLLGGLLAAVLSVAGCGGGGEDVGPEGPNADAPAVTVSKDPALTKLVPAQIRKRGELIVVTNAPDPPMSIVNDDKSLTGFDIDLGNAIGDVLGLDVAWRNAAHDAVIPGLAARRYDISIAGFSVEPERLEVVDFVGYYLSGGSFVIKRGSGVEVNDFAGTMCGKRVAVQRGISQVERIQGAKEYCAKNGKEPVEILEISDQNVVFLTLNSNRADVVAVDKPEAEFASKRSPQLCITGSYQTLHSIAGVAVPKHWPAEFNEALQGAVNKLIDSGAYRQISEKWGVGLPSDTKLSAEYNEISKEWGVGLDGAIKESKIFTDPKQIDPSEEIFPQPIKEGCA